MKKPMFKFPVYLKFHNKGNQIITTPQFQYNFWIKIFNDADITVICEDDTVSNFCNHRIINKIENYENLWQQKVIDKLSIRWKNHAKANLTPTIDTNSPYFWIIDADDLLFIEKSEKDLQKIISSLLEVEKICEKEQLDFCNLDINYTYHMYRLKNMPNNINWGHACLGVSLMSSHNFYILDRIIEEDWGLNQDVILEVMHHTYKNSKIFTITDIIFEQYMGINRQHSLFFNKKQLVSGYFHPIQVNNLPIKSQIIF